MTPEEEIRRGREAAIVISNPIYKEAMIIIRAQMMETFYNTNADQTEERDEIWRQGKIVDWFERQLDSVMKTGKMATATLNQQNQE